MIVNLQSSQKLKNHYCLLCNLNKHLEQRYYVDDGCHSDPSIPDDFVGTYHPKSFNAGIRCCKDPAASTGDCITIDRCDDGTGIVPYDEAVSKCQASSNHQRLCTKDELLSDICCGSGGQCDSHPVWTSTLETGNSLDN